MNCVDGMMQSIWAGLCIGGMVIIGALITGWMLNREGLKWEKELDEKYEKKINKVEV